MKFSLAPFRGGGSVPALGIGGSIGRRGNVLSVRCALRGDRSTLSVPARADAPERRDRLWEDTCFELFVGAEGSAAYREFNFSPAGHWNVYRFDSYREAMREEPAFASLPFGILADAQALRLSVDIDLGKILPPGKALDVGVCAVVRARAGDVGHWALAHPGPRPDFHLRDGFRLKVPAST